METWNDFVKTLPNQEEIQEIRRIAKLEGKHGTTFFLDNAELTYEEIEELIKKHM